MKRLSIRLILLSFVLILAGSGFTKKATAAKHADRLYYWYEQPGDWYYEQNTIEGDENTQWDMYGVLIDQNAGGGTLVATGYNLNTYPHVGPPSIRLYAHF
jgi:hypothetical protein